MRKLIIIDDEGRRTAVPLVRTEVTIGRQEGNTIRLTERNVSRRHARIFRDGSQYVLEDLSRYGTRKNGSRVAGTEPLAEGDVVIIGAYRVELTAEEAEDAAAEERTTARMPSPSPASISAPRRAAPAESTPEKPVPGAAPVPSAARGRLVCLTEPFVGSEFAFTADTMTLGTAPDCDMIIGHGSVAPHHARFDRVEGGFTITALDPGHPLALNGRARFGEPLRPGDELTVGELRFRFALPGQSVGLITAAEIPDEVLGNGRPAWFLPVLIGGVVVLLALIAMLVSGGDEPGPETAFEEPEPEPAAPIRSGVVERARGHLAAARWSDAIRELEAVPEDAEEYAMAAAMLGQARNEQANQQQYEAARRAFDEGDYEQTLRSLGTIRPGTYYRTRAEDENLERRALQAVVDSRLAASQLAQDDGDLDEALRVVEEIAPLAPGNTALAARIEQVRALRGQRAAAPDRRAAPEPERAEREAARPEREEPRAERERDEEVARREPEPARAEPEPEPSRAAPEDDRESRLERARQLRQDAARAGVQQNYPDAIRLLEEARELNPGDPQINLMLFSNYRQVGNRNRAASALRRYLRQRPDDPRRAEYEQWLEENAP